MVCEFLPAALGVGVWLAVLNCEGSIEKEDSLLGPFSEIAVVGHLESDFFVGR